MTKLIARKYTDHADVDGVIKCLSELREMSGATVVLVQTGEMSGAYVEAMALYEETLTDGSTTYYIELC